MSLSIAVAQMVRSSMLLIVLAACSQGSNAQRVGDDQSQGQVAASQRAGPIASSLPDFRPLVSEHGDAVVNVEAIQRRERAAAGRPMPEDPIFDFFRRFGIPAPESGPPQGNMPPVMGAGSGFIVSEDGCILTNAHLVTEADEVTVSLTDRREFQAEVIGVDPRTDVAVIKIDARGLPAVKIGDPDQLAPGQWVLAIGSPFGLDNSVTAGIVSATSRAVGPESYVPFIQTDVAVNPGNSGGPLFNLDGEVVGINSMIFSQTGGYMGLSFAIPIDVAINVRDQLIETGRVVRGRIGVAVQDMNAQLSESFGLDRPRGALVSGVEEGGPADQAGIETGDVILGVNGEPIDRFTELSGTIASLKPGVEADVRIWRDGKERDLGVRIGELQEEPARVSGGPQREEAGGPLGLAVRPLSPEEKRRVDTEGALVVEQVAGPAARSGVQPGDILLGINGTRIESVDQMNEIVEDASNTVALLIERGGAQIFVPVQVG